MHIVGLDAATPVSEIQFSYPCPPENIDDKNINNLQFSSENSPVNQHGKGHFICQNYIFYFLDKPKPITQTYNWSVFKTYKQLN